MMVHSSQFRLFAIFDIHNWPNLSFQNCNLFVICKKKYKITSTDCKTNDVQEGMFS